MRRLDAATGGIGPEELTYWRDRYADQVEALDCGLELFVESLAAMQQLDDTLLILAGCRGFPLGEHGRLGLVDQSLFEELVHIPLMIRAPGGFGRAQRTSQLVADIDLAATVAEACGLDDGRGAFGDGRSLIPLLRGDAAGLRDALFFQSSDGDRAVRTADWYLRLPRSSAANPPSTSDAQPELYSKPDDRWDANEISGLCADVAAELVERL
jgi:arylsulfatase A-like enzyme